MFSHIRAPVEADYSNRNGNLFDWGGWSFTKQVANAYITFLNNFFKTSLIYLYKKTAATLGYMFAILCPAAIT